MTKNKICHLIFDLLRYFKGGVPKRHNGEEF